MLRAWIGLALAIVLLPSGAAAQDGGVRFCHAFDAGTNTLFASQAVPADQAGRTVEAFAAFLKARGAEASSALGCSSAAGEPQAVRAREALARSCAGCNTGTRLVAVKWPAPPRAEAPPVETPSIQRASVALSGAANAAAPRGGGIAAQPMGGAPVPPTSPGPTRAAAAALPPAPTPTNAPHMGPLLIVMGHEESGRMIAVRDRPDLSDEAVRQAKAYRPSGWKVLLVSRETGSGAGICVSENGKTRFFVAHPFPTVREAIKAAQDMARPTAARTRSVFFSCGPPWTVLGIGPPPPEPSVSARVVGTVKGKLRELVTCQEPPKPPETRPIAKPCEPQRQRRVRTTPACMCVRG